MTSCDRTVSAESAPPAEGRHVDGGVLFELGADAGPRPPLPMIPFRPSSSSRGVHLSIRLAVVGPPTPSRGRGVPGVGT